MEVSDPLIDSQEFELCGKTTPQLTDQDYVRQNRSKSGIPIVWHKSLDTVPKKVGFKFTFYYILF